MLCAGEGIEGCVVVEGQEPDPVGDENRDEKFEMRQSLMDTSQQGRRAMKMRDARFDSAARRIGEENKGRKHAW